MNSVWQRIITGFVLLISFLLIFFCMPPFIFSTLLIVALAYIICVEWPQLAQPHPHFFWLITPLYPILPFLCMMLLNQDANNRILLAMGLLLTACFDTGAYCIGVIAGKYKIAPRISPNKTWEGLFGGFVSCLIGLFILSSYLSSTKHAPYKLICLAGLISLLAFVGDLFESALKRYARIKDTGKLLPGHGGLLDRIDSGMIVVLGIYLLRKQLIIFFQ